MASCLPNKSPNWSWSRETLEIWTRPPMSPMSCLANQYTVIYYIYAIYMSSASNELHTVHTLSYLIIYTLAPRKTCKENMADVAWEEANPNFFSWRCVWGFASSHAKSAIFSLHVCIVKLMSVGKLWGISWPSTAVGGKPVWPWRWAHSDLWPAHRWGYEMMYTYMTYMRWDHEKLDVLNVCTYISCISTSCLPVLSWKELLGWPPRIT